MPLAALEAHFTICPFRGCRFVAPSYQFRPLALPEDSPDAFVRPYRCPQCGMIFAPRDDGDGRTLDSLNPACHNPDS